MNVKKDEARGTWYFVVSAGKDSNGKRKQIFKRGFTSESLAKRELRKVMQQLDDNTYVKPSKITYSEFLTEWLQSKSLKLRSITLKTYTGHVVNHINARLGHFELNKITTTQIEKFYISLSLESKLSNHTISDIHKIVKNSFHSAVKRKYVTYSPVIEAETPKFKKKEMMVWTLKESALFLSHVKEHRLYPAFLLGLTTGMRQSEILGLRWKDVDFVNEHLNVRQTLSHDGKELTVQTKTESSKRTISLYQEVLTTLEEHRRLIDNEKAAISPHYQENDLVIPTGIGTPMSPRNLLRTFYSYIEKANVPKIRFHDLRHTFATLLLTQGTNPKVVMEILGHAEIKTTLDIYSHVFQSVHKDTAQKYGDMLFKRSDENQDK